MVFQGNKISKQYILNWLNMIANNPIKSVERDSLKFLNSLFSLLALSNMPGLTA